ncbi:Protein involved in (1,3)-beta-glucan synthesis [Scheffersomyces stipitis CBS 6054]|uniref:Protein involved in (1,3)-beta-glucan synthesis n=1 Tax=Scheffersomyces stipitis (strain ATCC 58785 / CBS 6054 / NBRC 10063 / NRRL Y-11545) TaxID=322104 RepID=A3LWV9_PICST|nr:Protein involved in (1,3)-beta-glucan synthesis [Scheffersomyces stipitis CBS 6054]ABN67349.2 Protein involved in (1,3)-beta-glucan synthesis [Scheffersomyces stipitis CBS 6054]KAG2732629.1 hypothetical protein G9P44_005046 [Scheffersomyces stipitis]
MGLMDNFKAFVHSITTDDHYATYDSPYKHTGSANGSNVEGGSGANGSSSRLSELNRLNAYQNSSSHSLVDGSRNSSTSNVGYRPGQKSSGTVTEYPLQTLNQSGQPPLPTIDSLWDRIESWIDDEYPELEDYLNDGVTTADLNEFENDLGCGSLPVEFRQFYKRHDGQFRGGKPTGLIMGLALLDLEGIAEEYAVWSKVAQRLEGQQYIVQQQQQQQQKETSSSAATATQRPLSNTFIANQRSIPPNSVQPYYYHKGWVPILKDHIGNQIALDLAPGPQGIWGQVIIFGRDYDTKLVVASSFQEFIFNFVNDLEAGNYEIDSAQLHEDLGYLSNSRNDDYMIGDEDEDQGELTFYDQGGKEFGKGALKGVSSYVEVIKRRSLKKYGLTENFSTTFTPVRVPVKKPAAPSATESGSNTPLRAQSPSLGQSSTAAKSSGSSPLINVESANKSVTLQRETIIDDKLETETENKIEDKIIKEEPEIASKTEESDDALVTAEESEQPEDQPLIEGSEGIEEGLKDVAL